MENDICKFKENGSIVLIGDTNSRIGTFNDLILNDDDKHSPVPDAYVSDENENLLNRHNEDISSVNTYGRRLLDLCKDHEMYGVPFYYLFPIYGYPKFILGYP